MSTVKPAAGSKPDLPADRGVLEGLISVGAALQARNRVIHTIYVRTDHTDDRVSQLEQRARSSGITVERVTAEVIEAYATGKTHGGVVALVGPRRYASLDDLLHGGALPFVVMLDGVEDPFNFGEAVRSLYAAGVDGLVLRPRNWMSAAGVVARASGGASELMPTALAETALDAASFFKARGLSVACAVKRNAASIYEARLAIPLFLVVGGEKRGISRLLVERADLQLQVPYHRDFAASLGTAAAAAVIAFEVMRQRQHGR